MLVTNDFMGWFCLDILNAFLILLRAVFGKKNLYFFGNFVFLHSRIKSNNLSFGKKEVFLFFMPNLNFFNK